MPSVPVDCRRKKSINRCWRTKKPSSFFSHRHHRTANPQQKQQLPPLIQNTTQQQNEQPIFPAVRVFLYVYIPTRQNFLMKITSDSIQLHNKTFFLWSYVFTVFEKLLWNLLHFMKLNHISQEIFSLCTWYLPIYRKCMKITFTVAFFTRLEFTHF